MSTNIIVVVGTRPEAIKLAPVVGALDARGLTPTLVFTGQHPQLEPADYRLGAFPAIRLRCPGQDDPHSHVGMVSKAVVKVLAMANPDLVIVQGDTSSALGGALAAKLAGVHLAHVEAGLRSHDLRRPWPEEEFRVAIDRDSDLLFAPTELSAANLRRERVNGQIHVTGNSGIDALLELQARPHQPPASNDPRLLVTCHRRENWGDGLCGLASALRRIASEGIARVEVMLHPNPAQANRVRQLLLGLEGIAFRAPCGHPEIIAAMLGSAVILSDSGGMQEEAAVLGVPLLVLRDKTERPEAIVSGTIEMVGTDPERIVSAVRRSLTSARPMLPALPFGDGRAGERIAAMIEDWLAERGLLSPARCHDFSAVPRTA